MLVNYSLVTYSLELDKKLLDYVNEICEKNNLKLEAESNISGVVYKATPIHEHDIEEV